MNRGLIKNALVTIALTLILLTGYTLGTLTAPSRAEKEQTTVEPTPQEKTATPTPQETQTTTQDQVNADSAVVQRLDRIASILEDRLSSMNSKLAYHSKKLKEIHDNVTKELRDIYVRLASIGATTQLIKYAVGGGDVESYGDKLDEIIRLLRLII